MADYGTLVAEEITATLDRAGFQHLSSSRFRIDVTETFQRKLGECQVVHDGDGENAGEQYRIRIARRLFKHEVDTNWEDTVRHEVAHAYVQLPIWAGDPAARYRVETGSQTRRSGSYRSVRR